ncbi:hypothetical protein [Streptosporangium sp. H16]|uniref:hypothetical protein n=1 Tax=Streptosporangium sp. H16 TaxID=3444184 RepID=UPI003F792D33
MAFDEARYIREVLDPARQAGGTLPADLRQRYQLEETVSAAEITETVRQVRQCWRRSRQMLKYRKIIGLLETDHAHRFAAIFQAAEGGDLGPLRAEVKEAGERDRRRLNDARRRLDDAAGKLRLLPPDVVAGIATSAEIGQGQATGLAGELGIEVREPDRLPHSAPYAAYGKVREALDTLRAGNLAMFLFTDQGEGIRVLGPPEGILDRVAEVEQATRRKPRGSATAGAETVCSALRAIADPAALVLYDVVVRLRERVREHPYDDTLLRHAVDDLHVDPGDAKRLIFAIRHETGVAGGPAARLRELVDGGEIQAAADFAEALPPDALSGEAAELATEIWARLDKAVRLRDLARTENDGDKAWIMLEDALRRVPDLPGAEDLLAGLAPHPPSRVVARIQGNAVVVTWTASPSRAGDITYDVYRDGVPFAESARSGVRDDGPPVNEPVTYAVAARRGRAASAQVTAASVVSRPEPGALTLTAEDGVVVGRWTVPPEAVRVLVTRDGVPVAVTGSGFRDRDVRNGTGHEYVVAAVYRSAEGDVTTPGLRHVVTPRARPEPVADFAVEPHGQDRLLVRCAEPQAGGLEFFSLSEAPPWPYGAGVPVADVRAVGHPLRAAPAEGGFLIRPERASSVLLAVTVAGDLAIIGAHREHLNLAAPRRLTVQRRGEVVYLGLEWPQDVPEVEVRWGERRLLVSAAAYRSQGGIRLEVPENEAPVIEVAPTVTVRNERVRGTPVSVRLDAVVPVRYDLLTAGSPWRRELVVELTSDRPVRIDRFVLVLKAGRIQPRSADDGFVLHEWSAVTTPARLTLPPPRHARPYWLRCFAEGSVELVDPPVRVLKKG